MSIRRSYVDWKPFTGNEGLESGKTYMVFEQIGNNIGKPHFATYHDRGDIVRVTIDPEHQVEGVPATTEEKLLESIFGQSRVYVIPYAGFYIMTSDYGLDDEFENCTEMPVCVGNAETKESESCPCFWAELPLEPENWEYAGLSHTKIARSEKDQAKFDELNDLLAKDEIALDAFHGIVGKDKIADDTKIERPFGACNYRIRTDLAAGRVLRIAIACRKMAELGEDVMTDFAVKFHRMKPDEGEKFVREFMKAHDIDPMLIRYVMFDTMLEDTMNPADPPNFFWHRDQILKRGGTHALNTVAVMQEARGKSAMPFRIHRIIKLWRMGAPEIILKNEVRVAAEMEILGSCTGYITSVDPDRFADTFGIWPDGSRREGMPCSLGDAELVALGREREEDEENEDEDRYIWSFSPNFLMRRKGSPILDRRERRYLRDGDGNVILYETCPQEKLAELNAKN